MKTPDWIYLVISEFEGRTTILNAFYDGKAAKQNKSQILNFIEEGRVVVKTLRNHSLYGDQSKKAKMLGEERANVQEWLLDSLELILDK